MSNDVIGRFITNLLAPYWKDHPGQRDAVHGLYHYGAEKMWDFGSMLFQAAGDIDMARECYSRAEDDRRRCYMHWFQGINRNDRDNYNPSPERK